MAVQSIPYEPSLFVDWDSFLTKSCNGTIFNLRKFLDYHPLGRFSDASALFARRGQIVACVPASLIDRDGARLLASHPGASWGGLIHRETLTFQHALQVAAELTAFASRLGAQNVEITCPPQCYCEPYFNHQAESALVYAGYYRVREEMSFVLDLEAFESSRGAVATSAFARNARHGERLGVLVREIQDLSEIQQVYEMVRRRLNSKFGRNPVHSWTEIVELKSRFPKDIQFFGAYVGKDMAAGVMIIRASRKAALVFYVSHEEAFQAFRPLNVLFISIAGTYAERGYKYLDLGLATNGMSPNLGLIHFKEGLGARAIPRTTWGRSAGGSS